MIAPRAGWKLSSSKAACLHAGNFMGSGALLAHMNFPAPIEPMLRGHFI
jgi:hypothetical protein